MKVLSLFSGIGAFEKALDRCGVPYELVNYCEIDKYAAKAYSLIHDVSQELNLGDITKVDTSKLDKVDMITYAFPCQDISNAGKQKGFADENGERTRSGLFFEALRIIEDTKPKFAICENVKALTGKKFREEFGIVLESLESAGYNNYWQVLNAKDYGIPQNRERVFIVSIRKDIDQGYDFPQPIRLELRLKDMLEDKVDEKYYLTNEPILNKVCCGDENPSIVQVGNIMAAGSWDNPQCGRVYSADGLSPTLNTCGGGQREPKIVEPMCAASRGRNPNNPSDRTAGAYTEQRLRIRKLTPKECWRLMGFDDADIDVCIENGINNSQLYKMAGNSIVVDVLEAIFGKLGEVYGEFERR